LIHAYAIALASLVFFPLFFVVGDLGCELKVKCRPVRADGSQGEVFTSKASAVITNEVLVECEEATVEVVSGEKGGDGRNADDNDDEDAVVIVDAAEAEMLRIGSATPDHLDAANPNGDRSI
jgi:hypothetical protein